jgi:hypothetical protein
MGHYVFSVLGRLETNNIRSCLSIYIDLSFFHVNFNSKKKKDTFVGARAV